MSKIKHMTKKNGQPNKTAPRAGVYVVEHPSTGQFYVGSSGNLYNRERMHINGLKTGKNVNKNLKAAYDKDPNIEFKILQETATREEALDLEQAYLDKNKGNPAMMNVGMNARKGALGVSVSEETRRKMSVSQANSPFREQRIAKIAAANRGRSVASGTVTVSAEGLARRRIARTEATGVKVEIDGILYESVSAAARAKGVSTQHIDKHYRNLDCSKKNTV